MYNLISRYMNKLTKEDLNNFAISKNIFLSPEETDFAYEFVTKNWEQILNNPNLLNLDRYKNRFSEENFIKIKKLYIEYSSKYKNFL